MFLKSVYHNVGSLKNAFNQSLAINSAINSNLCLFPLKKVRVIRSRLYMNSWLNLLSYKGFTSRKLVTSSKGMGATTSKFSRLSRPCTTLVFSALVLFNRGPLSTRSNLPSILTAVMADAAPAGTENFSSTGPLMATLVKLYLMAVMWSWPVWQGITVRWACIQKQILLFSHCVLVSAFFVLPAADMSFVIATKLPQHWYKK